MQDITCPHCKKEFEIEVQGLEVIDYIWVDLPQWPPTRIKIDAIPSDFVVGQMIHIGDEEMLCKIHKIIDPDKGLLEVVGT